MTAEEKSPRRGDDEMCAGEDEWPAVNANDSRTTITGLPEDIQNPQGDDIVSDTDVDELGPVDYVVVEFPADKANFSGEMASALADLVKRNLIRMLDLLILRKQLD